MPERILMWDTTSFWADSGTLIAFRRMPSTR